MGSNCVLNFWVCVRGITAIWSSFFIRFLYYYDIFFFFCNAKKHPPVALMSRSSLLAGRRHNSVGRCTSVMMVSDEYNCFISFAEMTPFCSLLSFSHLGNGRFWNWILCTLRWLYKGIILDGYCAIRDVMKLAQRWQLYRGRSLLIYGDLPLYNMGVCQPQKEKSPDFSSQAEQPWETLFVLWSFILFIFFPLHTRSAFAGKNDLREQMSWDQRRTEPAVFMCTSSLCSLSALLCSPFKYQTPSKILCVFCILSDRLRYC